jgi:hypothetical protein
MPIGIFVFKIPKQENAGLMMPEVLLFIAPALKDKL